MGGIRAIKVNNVINKNLTFKFDGHPISTITIISAILLITAVVLGHTFFYLFFIVIFFLILILNILSIYSVSFDNDNIIIKNRFKKHTICYRNSIQITITRGVNPTSGTYRRLAKEHKWKYSLVINDGDENFILASTVNDSNLHEITKFIENFSFEENIEKNKKHNTDTHIRFVRELKD